jgi:hypothetical protein
MPKLLHTFECPFDSLPLRFVLNLGLTQAEYSEGIAAGEYRAVEDIPNWEAVMGDAPKPAFPLTTETIGALPFVAIRYVDSGMVVRDGLDDFMEARSPN